ncbi:MAG: DUF2066 domain-containing protein [Nitrospinae bacterium]|nr:DUF2066 domain-containing protein [Nitrospinota bacterium]
MTLFDKRSLLPVFLCLWCFLFLGQNPPAEGQEKLPSVFVAKTEASAANGDFVRARRNAVAQAMKLAVEKCLREILGEREYDANLKTAKVLIADAERYVRSYRFLRAYDDIENSKSEVDLEVSLFVDAIRRRLGSHGIVEGPSASKVVAVLVHEKRGAGKESAAFWESSPVSEKLLARSFISAGIRVVTRDSVQGSVGADIIARAARGDIGAAADIGQKAGADIVVVGNAVTSPLDEGGSGKTVQASMSLKAFSAYKFRAVAAKSDLASAHRPTEAEAEAEAMDKVAKKLGEFFLSSIQRYWNPALAAQPDVSSPSPAAPVNPQEDL